MVLYRSLLQITSHRPVSVKNHDGYLPTINRARRGKARRRRLSSWKPFDKMLLPATAKSVIPLFLTNICTYVSSLWRMMRTTIRGERYKRIRRYKFQEHNFLGQYADVSKFSVFASFRAAYQPCFPVAFPSFKDIKKREF